TSDQAMDYLHAPMDRRRTAIEQPSENGRPSARPPASAPAEIKTSAWGRGDYKKWIYGPLAGLLLIAAVVGISRRADRAPAGEVARAPAPVVTTAPRRLRRYRTLKHQKHRN